MNTQAFLESIQNRCVRDELETESEEARREKAICEAAEAEFIEKNTIDYSTEEKESFKCNFCSKFFKEKKYVKTHLLNRHTQIVKINNTKQTLLQLVRSEYLRNPEAKIPNVKSSMQREDMAVQAKEMNEEMKMRFNSYGRNAWGE